VALNQVEILRQTEILDLLEAQEILVALNQVEIPKQKEVQIREVLKNETIIHHKTDHRLVEIQEVHHRAEILDLLLQEVLLLEALVEAHLHQEEKEIKKYSYTKNSII
jgi:hypothetical protein